MNEQKDLPQHADTINNYFHIVQSFCNHLPISPPDGWWDGEPADEGSSWSVLTFIALAGLNTYTYFYATTWHAILIGFASFAAFWASMTASVDDGGFWSCLFFPLLGVGIFLMFLM